MIDINDPLLERAKRYAADQGKHLADIVHDALMEKLGREEHPVSVAQPFRFLTFGQGGVHPGVDLNSNVSLQDTQDAELCDPATGVVDLDRMR